MWTVAALVAVTTGIAAILSSSTLLGNLELQLEPLLDHSASPGARAEYVEKPRMQLPGEKWEVVPNHSKPQDSLTQDSKRTGTQGTVPSLSTYAASYSTVDPNGVFPEERTGARSLEFAHGPAVCGDMPNTWLPASGLPSLSDPGDLEAASNVPMLVEIRERRLQQWGPGSGGGSCCWFHRRLKGYTVMGAGCGKSREYKVPHEHDGSGPRVQKRPKPSEGPLIECIKNVRKCGEAAKRAARSLPGVKLLLSKQGQLRVNGLEPMYDNCALVGNAGHLSKRQYGQYIDSHQLVVRFNVQKTFEFSAYVGNKTTLRVVNHRRSLAMCCRGNWPEAKAGMKSSGMMIWFPAAQQDILDACQKRYPDNPRMVLPSSAIKHEIQAMVVMRKDLQRLGFGPFGAWRQMTSGSHAALLFATMCRSVSLFGFTTYGGNSAGGADQYAAAIMKQDQGAKSTKLGATTKARSGEKWHDWKGEKFVLRLLNAAGITTICSM